MEPHSAYNFFHIFTQDWGRNGIETNGLLKEKNLEQKLITFGLHFLLPRPFCEFKAEMRENLNLSLFLDRTGNATNVLKKCQQMSAKGIFNYYKEFQQGGIAQR